MVEPPAPTTGPGAQAALDELSRVQLQTRAAQAVLDQLHADVTQAQGVLAAGQQARVVAVNQQLVLAMLRAQIDIEAHEQSLRQAADLATQQTARAHDQLVDRLCEANEQLVLAAVRAQTLQDGAEAARQRQTSLLALVAHELRHPLAPIRNAAALLGRIPTDQPVLGRLQSVIERQVVHMSRLVGDLLDVTRVETGKLRIERSRIDVVPLVTEVVDYLQPVVAKRTQQLSLQLPADPVVVDGDAMRLTQVLFNLLENASKYTHVGGAIDVSMVASADHVAITVSDTGIGITPEALPHVFDPFVQDLHATVFNGAGLGIGLTVVRELVEAHGGTVAALSAGTGFGSQFCVRLPWPPAASSQPATP